MYFTWRSSSWRHSLSQGSDTRSKVDLQLRGHNMRWRHLTGSMRAYHNIAIDTDKCSTVCAPSVAVTAGVGGGDGRGDSERWRTAVRLTESLWARRILFPLARHCMVVTKLQYRHSNGCLHLPLWHLRRARMNEIKYRQVDTASGNHNLSWPNNEIRPAWTGHRRSILN